MGANLSNNLKKNCGLKEPKVIITRAWLMSLLCVITVFLLACVGASKLKKNDADQTTAFFAMWTVLLLLGISVAGTVIMRKYQTNLAIGGFMGVIVVMTNQCLILFAIFVDQSQTTSNTAAATQIYQGMAAFFFLLSAIYGLFCVLLGSFKDVIVQPEEDFNEIAVGGGAGPAQGGRVHEDVDFDEMPPINI